MTLGSKIEYFIWLNFLDYSDKVTGICQVSVVEVEMDIFFVGVVVEVVYSICVEGG